MWYRWGAADSHKSQPLRRVPNLLAGDVQISRCHVRSLNIQALCSQ